MMEAALRSWVRRAVGARVDGPETGVERAIGRLVEEVRLARATRGSAKRLRALSGPGLKVNLGCGRDVREGWVNVDLPGAGAGEDDAFIAHDLRRGLPVPEGSCALIHASHLLEHLAFAEGRRLLADCRRALAGGGRLRVAQPDFEQVLDAYVRGDERYFEDVELAYGLDGREPGLETLVDQLNYAVYQNGEHRYIWDREKLTRTLQAVGFAEVRESLFDPAVDVDEPVRRRHSFYVDATAS